jgi:carbamoyltransferase
MKGALLGPSFSDQEIMKAVEPFGAKYRVYDDARLADTAADLIVSEKVIGWFQGRMEFGPRALGARSILGDARSPKMQSQMNVKIKFRESFRPFAPCVLAEHVSDYFDLHCESPYMLLVAPLLEKHRLRTGSNGKRGLDRLKELRSTVPAITHVDYSARVQTVDRERHGLYYDVIKAFHEKTGCPVIVNTSFNIRGEPIVCRPEEAYRCFMFTDMDALVLGHQVFLKEEQPPLAGAEEYKRRFKLD